MWRDHRSATVRDVKEEAKRIGLNRAIANLKPNNVDSMDEWKAFMKKMCSAEYEERSEKFKQMRASQTLPHTTSRKGYARLEEELLKKADNPDDIKRVDVWFKGHEPKDGIYKDDKAKETMEKVKKVIDESSEDQYSIADDAVSKVIGPERRGRIRGLGFGATQTKLQRSSYHRDKVSKLESQLKEMNDRMNQLNELVCNKLVAPMPEPSGPSGLEGRKCHILDWVSGRVGKGEIASTDPTSLVHHIPVGKGCWKIWVFEVFDSTVSCFRPTREFFLLHEALSSMLAWPSEFIRVIES